MFTHYGPTTGTHRPVTAEVCPNSEANPATPQSIADWARDKFEFEASPRQTEILNLDAKYLILCCNRQWGKTTTIALKALYEALHKPKLSICVISRTKEQAGLLIEKVSDCAVHLGLRVRRVLGQRYSFKFPNGSQIVAVPHNEDTSAGRTANILIVDEAARVSDRVYFSTSCYVVRTHGAIWLLSTPKRQAGFFYNFWHNADPKWKRVFSNVHDCPDLDPDYLDIQKRADPHGYAQDFECQFTQPPEYLVTTEQFQKMMLSEEEKKAIEKENWLGWPPKDPKK